VSTVFVTDIRGTGIYAVPSSDAAILIAQAGLRSILSAVPDLSFEGAYAFVKTTDGAGAVRSLCCLITNVYYGGEMCPDHAATVDMTDAIAAGLTADPNISSVSIQDVSLVESGSGGIIPSYDNVLFVAQHGGLTENGSLEAPYKEVSSAMAAASQGITIIIFPGDYSGNFEFKQGVDVVGTDRDRCVLWAQKPVLYFAAGYTSSVVRSMTLRSSPPLGSPAIVLFDLVGSPVFEDCKLTWSKLWHQHRSYISADKPGFGDSPVFRNCFFDEIDVVIKPGNASDLDLLIDRCRGQSDITFHGLGGERLHVLRTDMDEFMLEFTAEGGSVTLEMDRSHVFLNRDATPTISINAGPGVSVPIIRDSEVVSQVSRGLYIAADIPVLRLSDSTFNGATGDIYVVKGYRADAWEYDNCTMVNGGVRVESGGYFNHVNRDVLHVGGKIDCYYELQAALDGLDGNGHTIQLHKDVTLATELILSNEVKIDGMNKHSISRDKHGMIVRVGTSQQVTFDNIYIEGTLCSTGGLIILEANVEVEGLCRLDGDVGLQCLYLHGATVVGDGDNGPALQINVGKDSVLLRDAKIKGFTSRPAIEWTVVNDNVKLEHTKAVHGLGGNPFSITVVGNVKYTSHHCAYNSNPQAGGTFTNNIATPYDVINANVDF
jgi:hypothetical protein